MGRLFELRRSRRFKADCRGGAAVELAVVFPIFVLLLIGIIDYGRLFYTAVTVSNAARAGAEFGAQDFSTQTNTPQMAVVAQADGKDAGTLDLVTTPPRFYCECAGILKSPCGVCTGGAAPEVYVEVTAIKTVNLLLRYPGIPASVTVRRTATFRSQ